MNAYITNITTITIAMTINISKAPSMSNGIPKPSPNLAKPLLESLLSPSLLIIIPIIANGTNMKSPINIVSIGITNSAQSIKVRAPNDSTAVAEIPFLGS